MLLDASVGEICRGIEVRIHRTLDARLDNEEVIRRDVEGQLRIQPALLLLVEYPIEGIVSEQEAQSSAAAVCGHTGLTDTLLVRPAEADLLPVTLVSGAKPLLLHLGAQAYQLQSTLLFLSELQHTLARAVLQLKLAVPIPGPSNAFT